jgi:hypothetical protein
MKKNRDISYLLIPNIDGVTTAFPVSRHILDTSATEHQSGHFVGKVRRAIPTLVRPATSLMLLVCLCASTLGATYARSNTTLSYFRDTETSTLNLFSAALLDFFVLDETYARTISTATSSIAIPVMTPENGSVETLYKVTAEEVGGPAALCGILTMQATTSPFLYSGPLLSLNTTATTTTGSWTFGLTLATTTGLIDGDICEVDLVYRGWYPTMPEYTGFTDEERVRLVITYDEIILMGADADVVLNEFLPNPDTSANGMNLGTDSSSMPLGEWIELYNKGTGPVDVLDWYMADALGGAGNTHAVIGPSNTNTGSTIIPPGGWLFVYTNKATLNNTGDEIHLFTDDDVEVDFVAYDNPSDYCTNDITDGTANSDYSNATGTPGNGPGADCSQNQVAPNKSYARFPDGTGQWYDPVPTPGFHNIVLPGDPLMEMPDETSDTIVTPAESETAEPAEEIIKEEAAAPALPTTGGATGAPAPTPAENSAETVTAPGDAPAGDTHAPPEPLAEEAVPTTETPSPATTETDTEAAHEPAPEPEAVQEPAPGPTPEPVSKPAPEPAPVSENVTLE